MGAEKIFENRVKDFLKEQECWFIKYWGGGEYTKAGIPDILVCCNGHFIGVEIKAPRGKPSPLQIRNLKKIHDAGGFAVLLYPRDIDFFKHLVENLKCGNEFEVSLANEILMKEWIEWYHKFRREGLLT